MTSSWIAYDQPQLHIFERATFTKTIAPWRARLFERALAHRTSACVFDGGWLHLNVDVPPRAASRWLTKLYVCVGPRDYFAVAEKIITLALAHSLRAKICLPEKRGYARPDKIVFYVHPSDVAQTLKLLRPLLQGAEFTSFFHAAKPSALGLERTKAGGIYLGSDPLFLDGGRVSWRMYRCLAVAWSSLNAEYLESRPGGIEAWRAKMNLSAKHEGPLSLTPNAKHHAFVRAQWKLINDFER